MRELELAGGRDQCMERRGHGCDVRDRRGRGEENNRDDDGERGGA